MGGLPSASRCEKQSGSSAVGLIASEALVVPKLFEENADR
jgi:hypothetical protein